MHTRNVTIGSQTISFETGQLTANVSFSFVRLEFPTE
jgi:hypothetical protein